MSAIDGDLQTKSQTATNQPGWWMAESSSTVIVDKILLYLNGHLFGKGYYADLKVETRITGTGEWTLCKGPYTVTGDIDPHVVHCNHDAIAKFIRVSTENSKGSLSLREVKLIGYEGGFKLTIFYSFVLQKLVIFKIYL